MLEKNPSKPGTPSAGIQLDLASHFIRVRNYPLRLKEILLGYCRSNLVQFGYVRGRNGRYHQQMLKVYVGVTRDRTIFHFHRNELDDLLRYLGNNGYPRSCLTINELPCGPGLPVDLVYIDMRIPRPDQIPKIEYMVQPGRTKLVTEDPGRGKTLMALNAISKIRKRVFVCIKAMYMDKWVADFESAFRLKKGDIMVIKGSAHLKTLTQLAKENQLEAKIIICSNTTYFGYLRDYELYKDDLLAMGYACVPADFYQLLQIGVRLIDEVHQDFHLNYRQDLYTNVDKTISLTGTLEGDNQFVNGRARVMFPMGIRIANSERVIYAAARAYEYRLQQPTRLTWTNNKKKVYSHVLFEQSIMKNKKTTKAYLEMLFDIYSQTYAVERKPGQKFLMYASTVDMCGLIADYFKERVSKDLKVTRYVSEDDYSKVLESDIISSTLQSLGTAQDIPGLLMVLMSTALDSTQANLQAFGRLRELKNWPGTTPVFMYLVCADIEKQVEYHVHKKEIFKGRVVGHSTYTTNHVI